MHASLALDERFGDVASALRDTPDDVAWHDWEAMRRRHHVEDPILSAAYLAAFTATFGTGPSGAPARPLIDADIAVLGMATVERHGGVPVRTWRLCVNDHSQRAPILHAPGAETVAADALVRLMLARRHSHDAFRLRGLPADTGFSSLVTAAALRAGMRIDTDFQRTQFGLDLTRFAGKDAYLDSLGATTQRTLRKARTRLQRIGRLETIVEDGADIAAAFADFKAVEARSWKSERGEFLAGNAEAERFYATMLGAFAKRGQAALWSLKLDGHSIAAAITISDGRRCLALKLAFDEALGAHSPGRLLLQDVIAAQFERGYRTLDFFSGMETWRHWSNTAWTFEDMTIWSPTLRGTAISLARRGVARLRGISRRAAAASS